jgi:hypothetical protein
MRRGAEGVRALEDLGDREVLLPDGTFGVAPEPGLAASPLKCLDDLEALAASQPELLEAIAEVRVKADQRRQVLESIQWTLNPDEHLANWCEVLSAEGVDPMAAQELGALAGRDALGHAEASRLIAHLIQGTGEWRRGPSAWLHSAVRESREYLEDWRRYEGSWVDWSKKQWASTTSGPWASSGERRATAAEVPSASGDSSRPWGAYEPAAGSSSASPGAGMWSWADQARALAAAGPPPPPPVVPQSPPPTTLAQASGSSEPSGPSLSPAPTSG